MRHVAVEVQGGGEQWSRPRQRSGLPLATRNAQGDVLIRVPCQQATATEQCAIYGVKGDRTT